MHPVRAIHMDHKPLTTDKIEILERHFNEIVTVLREEFDKRLELIGLHFKELLQTHAEALKDSIRIVREELDKRLQSIDEIRKQMQEQSVNFATRENVTLIVEPLKTSLQIMENKLNKWSGLHVGKFEGINMVSLVIAILAALVAMASLFMKG